MRLPDGSYTPALVRARLGKVNANPIVPGALVGPTTAISTEACSVVGAGKVAVIVTDMPDVFGAV
jgi:hypothetical protein